MNPEMKTPLSALLGLAIIWITPLGWADQPKSSGNFEIALMTGNADEIRQIIEHDPKYKDPSALGAPLVEAAEIGKDEIVKLLIVHGANVNAHGVWGYTALHFAVQRGNVPLVTFLLDHKADVNAPDDNGMTPIVTAGANIEVIKLLVAHGADVSSHGGDNTLLSQIMLRPESEQGIAEIKLLMANHVDVTANGTEGLFQMVLFNTSPKYVAMLTPYYVQSPNPAARVLWEGALCATMDHNRPDMTTVMVSDCLRLETDPISVASAKGDANAVASLISVKQSLVSETGTFGWTPLHIAALSDQPIIAEMLLANKADPDARDELENTPLIWATYFGCDKVVDVLLRHKASMDIASNQVNTTLGIAGNSALDFAIKRGFTQIATTLITNGAGIGTTKWYGETPLHLAATAGNAEVIRALLAHDANVNALTNSKVSPLEIAVAGDSPESVQILVAGGASVNAPTSGGGTLFHLWAVKGNPGIADQLVTAGVDPTAKDQEGQQPLEIAVKSRQMQAVQWLVDHKADVNAKDNDGLTPLHCAALQGGKQIVQFLLDHNADVNATDKQGRTALVKLVEEQRQRRGRGAFLDYPEIVKLMVAHGAKEPPPPPPSKNPMDEIVE
jgi:ankyrin repeat protein